MESSPTAKSASQSDDLIEVWVLAGRSTGPQQLFCARDVPRVIWPPLPRGDLHDGDVPARYVRDELPFRGCPIRDAARPRDDGAPRGRGVPPPCDDALLLVST